VLASIYIYSTPPATRQFARPKPIRIASFREAKIDRMNTPRPEEKLANPLENVKALGLSTSRPSSPMTRTATKGKVWEEDI
jgi:solute carrier family 35 (UDP-sugar transporter), member A1/2/3